MASTQLLPSKYSVNAFNWKKQFAFRNLAARESVARYTRKRMGWRLSEPNDLIYYQVKKINLGIKTL